MSVCRELRTTNQIEEFCKEVLGISGKQLEKVINKIEDEEAKLLAIKENENTYESTVFRNYRFRDKKKRRELISKIRLELLEKKRVDDETKIKLGVGGFLPKTTLKFEKIFFLVIGSPASGKTTISSKLADETGSILIDVDVAKRKLPEYSNNSKAATLTHKESQFICRPSGDFPYDPDNIMTQCLVQGSNIV